MKIFCSVIAWLTVACCCYSCGETEKKTELQLIPLPRNLTYAEGFFGLDGETRLILSGDAVVDRLDTLLNRGIAAVADYSLGYVSEKPGKNYIHLKLDPDLSGEENEGYKLEITPGQIELSAPRPAGLFYGVQTLLQMLSDDRLYQAAEKKWYLPALSLVDKPAFSYRGLHLDVSRHFFPPSFIKKYLDWMAMYKLNTFHWHLTDAGGWRLQIKKYPELTEKTAWRTKEDWREWWNKGDRRYAVKGEPGTYGGFYTQEDVREIVAYAAERCITVIPEIEMPGHSEEVLAVYPHLGCRGRSAKSGEFCVGKEEVFRFIEDVLTEVMELFPSEYIHIGGDEASVNSWKKCPDCRQRMKEEHLKEVKALQGYFIGRVGKFLQSKGRKMIGWDEITEGNLPSGTGIMSPGGESGGIQAAREGHRVIMTPGAFCYFDSYQADPATQPFAIGGFTPYLKVYSYDPVPSALRPEEARYIWGAQAKVWTEYIPTEAHVEYMLFPRLLSLAEVVWTPREKKNPEDFKRRVAAHLDRLKKQGVNVFTLSDRVDMQAEVDTAKRNIKISFDSEKYRPEIRYTRDGSMPDAHSSLYQGPFYITDSAKIKAVLIEDGKPAATVSSGRFDYHRAIGKPVKYTTLYSNSYPAAGEKTLTDGYRGGLTYSDGCWQGFLKHLDVTLDMGEPTDIHSVAAKFMQLTGPGVYMPVYVEVSVSEDGKNFTEIAHIENDVPADRPDLFFKEFKAEFEAKARYVRVFARKQAGFMFTDEIVVY